jgi:DNA-binding beta-propeller fold protein YncE
MMKHLTNGIARTALIAAVATATLVNSLAQEEPRYGLYIGDRDTYRVITYLQPTYDPRYGDLALALRWSCAYSQFAKGYQSNPLEQVYIYGIAVDWNNGRIWASDHLRNRIVAFDRDGNYIRHFALPPGATAPRKMAISNLFGRTYLYVSAGGRLWVFGPLEDLDNATWEPFIDDDNNNQVSSGSGVRFFGVHVLISNSGGKAARYKLSSYRSGKRTLEWNAAGEDIDYIDNDTILLAVPGGTIKRLKISDPNDITDLITGLPGIWQGIAVGPEEIDGTRFIYIATYQTFPNALIVYRYNPNDEEEPLQWFGAASPLPFKSGYAVAIGPVWDCSQCNTSCPEDVNRDGVVNDIDLLRILFAFGSSCGN